MPTRVLAPGLLAGIRPAPNARELTTFDLGLYGGTDHRPVNSIRDASYGVDIRLPPPPKLLPSAIQQNQLHQVLPCQGIADAVRIGRPQRATDTEGMYPKTGYPPSIDRACCVCHTSSGTSQMKYASVEKMRPRSWLTIQLCSPRLKLITRSKRMLLSFLQKTSLRF